MRLALNRLGRGLLLRGRWNWANQKQSLASSLRFQGVPQPESGSMSMSMGGSDKWRKLRWRLGGVVSKARQMGRVTISNRWEHDVVLPVGVGAGSSGWLRRRDLLYGVVRKKETVHIK